MNMEVSLIKKSVLLLSMLLLITSCARLAMRENVRFYDKARVKYITDGSKTVAYIPMMHINKPAFYESVKLKVDSLREDGYTIFYESISITHPVNSLLKDSIDRKLRKVLGMHISDYSDKNNKAMRKFQLKGLVSQSHKNTGVLPTIDIRADLPMDSLIQIYEKNRGRIVLEKCDFKTPLNDKYRCNKAINDEAVFLVLTIRDQLVAKRILFESNNKIAIVYGALHYNGILKELQKLNNKWQYIEYR